MQSLYRASTLEHDTDQTRVDERQMSGPIDVLCGRG